MKRVLLILVIGLAVFGLLFGCARKTKVKRVKIDKKIDISGNWNDTDSRLVSEEMIEDSLSRPWLENFLYDKDNRRPVVIVGSIRNNSMEHINVQTFTKDLERALLNSGRVNFVASRVEREELREERMDQAQESERKTVKRNLREKGADFMLIGTINAIEDKERRRSVMYYQVNLELVNIETNQKVWIGEKKIKKKIKSGKHPR